MKPRSTVTPGSGHLKPAHSTPRNRVVTCLALNAMILSSCLAATANLDPIDDAHVRDGTYNSTNFNETTLMVKDGDANYNRHALLKFNVAEVNGKVTSATLRIYVTAKEGGSDIVPVSLYEVGNDIWEESSVTWNSQPATGDVIDTADVTAAGWISFEVTSYVAAQIAADSLASFKLTCTNESNKSVTFDSRTGTNAPVLDLVYDEATPNTLSASYDSYVRDGTYATTGFDSASTLEVKDGATDYHRSTLLQFNASSITGEVVSAKLRLYASSLENNSTIPVSTHKVTNDSWADVANRPVTWTNQPSHGALISTQLLSTTGWKEYYVTDHVAEQIATDGLISFKLVDTSGTNKNAVLQSTEGTNPPELIINVMPAPVTLAFIELDAYRDAYVRNGSFSGTNYGASTDLVVKNGTTDYNRETYLRFNLGVVTGTVHGAELKLNVTALEGSDPVTVDIYGVSNDSWFEVDRSVDSTSWPGIDWDNKPAPGTLVASINVTGAGLYAADVGSYAATQAVAGDKFASFVLKTTANKSITFSSKESSAPPKLEVDYAEGLRAFPGAAGPGGASRGAYTTTATPTIVRVTNRNNTGSGSFRAAVENDTPAVVIFDVGGQFPLESEVKIGSYKTIIGESAPEPVTFLAASSGSANRRVAIGGSHVVVTGLRVRPGTDIKADAIFVTRGNNDPMRTDVVVAFCSMSWTGDEIGGVWNGCQRVTYQYNFLGEAIEPTEPPYQDSNNLGFYFGSNREDVEDIAFVRNFITTVKLRVLGFKRTGSGVVAENIIYNWGGGDGAMIVYGNQPFGTTRLDILNNVLAAGPWTTAESVANRTFRIHQAGQYYINGNVTPAGTDSVYDTVTGVSLTSSPVFKGSYTPSVSGTTDVRNAVLPYAGARLAGALDSIDERKLDLYLNNTAKSTNTPEIVNGQPGYLTFDSYNATLGTSARTDSNNDGMYDAYESALGVSTSSLSPHDTISSVDGLGSQWTGYTRLEHQRHWLRTGSL